MLELLRNKRVMIVVAHPDDEVLGLGASMNRLIDEANIETKVVILGEGITSRSDQRNTAKWEQELAVHRQNINKAKDVIGYQSVVAYEFPDNRFDSVALLDIIKVIEKEKAAFQPDVIFTHHGGDVNIDHQRTFEAVITACRPLTSETVRTIVTFETPSGTEWRAGTDPRHFIPTLFFTFSEVHLTKKIAAMESYEFERRAYPHPRSPEALRIQAQRYGVTVGSTFAEAFALVRHIG
jgi:LmbE family N-acetylglucosaminyl deacetylase